MSAAGRCSSLAAILLALAAAAPAATYPPGSGFSDTAVVTGLTEPTDFTFLPDGRILILERAGRVLLTGSGGGATAVAADLRPLVEDNAPERGLLGITLHPNFATNGSVYLYFTTTAMSVTRNRISRFMMTGSTISSVETIILDDISSEAGNHNGGTILIGPDGKLWAAPGDSGTGGAKAQILDAASPSRFSGKILRMELDGSPAAGNPFLGDGTKEPRIWAYGFRNPFRFSFRPSNGSIYLGDVGQSTREEIDVGVAGGNFGWPYMEGAIQQPGGPGPCPMTTTCIPPVYDYPRSVGTTITGGVFVTGNAYPAFLQGKYLFGDYGPDWIRYLEFDSNDDVVGTLQNLASNAESPVAFRVGPDGSVYFAAIATGRIYRIDYPRNLHTLAPCRAVDTRDAPGPYGGPALGAGDRTFVLAGRCGIPPGARAVSVNLTVVQPPADGFLSVYPAGGATPTSSLINFRAGQIRANNAVLPLGAANDLIVRNGSTGAVHIILDVNGFFQ